MPDFDIDFCQDRRDEVIRYVQEKYGRDQVAQIITFGTLQARAVLRDVGRVLQMPYGQVDRLCKMVPQNPANPVTLGKAIEGEPRFAEEAAREPAVQTLLDMAQKLEGLYRHASTHAAGIVIGDRPLSELVPMYRDPRSDMPVTQFNMKYVEQAGLVKFDFLGLKTLTVLDRAVKLIRRRGIEIDLAHIPLDDEKTYAMLSRGEVVGIFQVESAGMRKALVGMKPDRIEDIIALVALYRPGPMENIPTYNARKHGEEEIASIHPKIDHLVEETQGVIVYQEQVMQIAQELSGYSLGEADLLRRAMGKKIRAEMDAQRARFVDGAVKNGLSKPQADFIFDLLAKFADYGFNKSHAAAYAVVSYQTAYLKAHYPVEFLAASMTLDMGNTDKLADFRQDALRLGIDVVAPSVKTSFRDFEVGENKIFYSLAALKGVGDAAVEHIVAKRQGKAVRQPRGFLRARRSEDRRQARAGNADHGRRARLLRLRPRGDDGRHRAHDGLGVARVRGCRARHHRHVRRLGRQPAEAASARHGAVAAGRPAASRVPGGRLLPLGASARRIPGGAEEDARADLGGVLGRREAGRDRRPARRHRDVEAGAQDAHRQQDGRGEFLRHVGPVRGGAVLRGARAVPRHAGAGQIACHHRVGRGSARGHQHAHPDSAIAGGCG